MKRLILVLSLVAAGCLSVPVRPPALNINSPYSGKWEYRQEVLCRVSAVQVAENTELMNRLGRDGWELVAITATTEGTEHCSIHTFKRRLRER